MYSQSLGDVLNKWLFKGRCYPVLPLNIPWDLESWSLDSGITLSVFRLRIHSFSMEDVIPSVWLQQCEAASSFHRGGAALPGPPHSVSQFWVYFPFFFKRLFVFLAYYQLWLELFSSAISPWSWRSAILPFVITMTGKWGASPHSKALPPWNPAANPFGLSSPRPGATSFSLFLAREPWSHFSILIFFF